MLLLLETSFEDNVSVVEPVATLLKSRKAAKKRTRMPATSNHRARSLGAVVVMFVFVLLFLEEKRKLNTIGLQESFQAHVFLVDLLR